MDNDWISTYFVCGSEQIKQFSVVVYRSVMIMFIRDSYRTYMYYVTYVLLFLPMNLCERCLWKLLKASSRENVPQNNSI